MGGVLFWVGGGGWVNILVGWEWNGVSRGRWGWVHSLITLIKIWYIVYIS